MTAVAGPFVTITSGYSKGATLDVFEVAYRARKHPIKHQREENGVVYSGWCIFRARGTILISQVPVTAFVTPDFVGAEKDCACFDWMILSMSNALLEEKLSPEDTIYVRCAYLLGSISRRSDIISAVCPPDPRTTTMCDGVVFGCLNRWSGRALEAKGRI